MILLEFLTVKPLPYEHLDYKDLHVGRLLLRSSKVRCSTSVH
jgi:hypothetical protein